MLTQLKTYYDILQLYFGIAVAVFGAAQPLLILLTSTAHAIEVQARNRGWARLNSAAYWVAKVCGTFAIVDMRNVQRVGGKVFVILAQVIEALNAKQAQKTKRVVDAMRDTGSPLVLLVAFLSLPILNGCAGTFEEARLARPQAFMVAKTPADRCSTLSDREYWFDVASYGMGAAGVGTVLAAIPASEKYDSALVISGAAAGAISVVSGFASQHAGAAYVREGCGR